MNNFWDNHSDARKVLVIPNITNYANIDKDSFVDVIYNHIKGLSTIGKYYFHVLMPTNNISKRLAEYDNVTQHPIDICGDMMNQRAFPSPELIKKLRDIDYDIIYSHLPDWPQVGRYKKTMHTKIIGYCHWWEMNGANGPDNRPGKPKDMWFINELAGVLQMDTCFVNTQAQLDVVIKYASEWLSVEKLEKLKSILKVWRLGVKERELEPEINKENIIVFNHRTAGYKGFPQFMEWMHEYREHRQDWKVWITGKPLQGDIREEAENTTWVSNTPKVPKKEYLKLLAICKIQITPKQTHHGWSIAATDCMMVGTVPIFQDTPYYREIWPNGLFFKTKKELFAFMDRMLDDDKWRTELEHQALHRCDQLVEDEMNSLHELHNLLN